MIEDRIGFFPASYAQLVKEGDRVFRCNRTFIGCKEQGQITIKEGQVSPQSWCFTSDCSTGDSFNKTEACDCLELLQYNVTPRLIILRCERIKSVNLSYLLIDVHVLDLHERRGREKRLYPCGQRKETRLRPVWRPGGHLNNRKRERDHVRERVRENTLLPSNWFYSLHLCGNERTGSGWSWRLETSQIRSKNVES